MRYLVLVAALLLIGGCSSSPSGSATLVLENPTWARVNVEAVITKSDDCDNRSDGYVSTTQFVMSKGQSHKIVAPHAENICWRHDRDPENPAPGDWSDWSRATLFPGQTTDTNL